MQKFQCKSQFQHFWVIWGVWWMVGLIISFHWKFWAPSCLIVFPRAKNFAGGGHWDFQRISKRIYLLYFVNLHLNYLKYCVYKYKIVLIRYAQYSNFRKHSYEYITTHIFYTNKCFAAILFRCLCYIVWSMACKLNEDINHRQKWIPKAV